MSFLSTALSLINQAIGVGILVSVSPVRYERVIVDDRNREKIDEEENGITVHQSYIAFKNIKCSMEVLMVNLESRGFQVVKIYRLADASLVAVCTLSTRLLLKMTSIYSTDLSNVKSADILKPQFHLRMAERAVDTLNKDFLQSISFQLIQDLPVSLCTALRSGKAAQTSGEFHKFFGSKIALSFTWMQFVKQSIYPGFLLWLLMMLSSEWDYAPTVGTLTSIVFSCSMAYWRVARSFYLHKWEIIRQLDDIDSIEYIRSRNKPYPSFIHTVKMVILNVALFLSASLIQILVVYTFDKLLAFSVITDYLLEIVYYLLSMSAALFAEHTIIKRLTDMEAHRTQRENITSFAIKQFILKIGVFFWKIVYLVMSGRTLDKVQLPVTVLMVIHCVCYTSISDCMESIYPQHCKISMAQISSKDISAAVMFHSRDLLLQHGEPIDAQGVKILEDCAKPYFSVSSLYSDSILCISAMMLVCPLSPACMPICILYTSMKLKAAIHHLVHDCQFPRLTEDSTMDPWLLIMETFSVIAMAWNIITLFVFSVDVSSFQDVVGEESGSMDSFMMNIFRWLNHCFGLPNTFVTMILWLVAFEHCALVLRCWLCPMMISMSKGFDLETQRALLSVAEGNELVATILFRANLLSEAAYIKAINAEQSDMWKHQYQVAETHHEDDPSMSPLLYTALALVPYICSTFFHISYYFTSVPLALMCGYHHMKIKRTKRAVALAIVSDPDVFDVVAENEFKQYSYSKETDRSAWCNKMLVLCWGALKEFAYNTIKAAADPQLEMNKPSFATHLKMSKLTMGNIPPHFLPGGIRILEPIAGKDMVEMEIDIVWNSDMEMAISLGLVMGQEITLNMSKLRFSGTCRVQCLPLIPFMPPFAWGKATFFKRPFIDFNLSFGDTELLDSTTSSSTITTVMQRILRNVLETMALYPSWITIPMVSKLERFAKTTKHSPAYYLTSYPMGVLSVKINKCNDLIVGDITTSDPYVVLTIRDEEFKTEVINATLNPEWKDALFYFLIYDKNMEFIHIEVWDKDVGSVGTFLGRVDVYLPNMEDGSHQSLTLQLQGVPSGTITMELGYNEIVNTGIGASSSLSDGVIEMKTLFDNMGQEDVGALLDFAGLTVPDAPEAVPGTKNVDFMKSTRKRMSTLNLPSFMSKHGADEMGLASQSTVAGVLTVSLVGFEDVKSVKTMLSNTQYFSPYITLQVGALKRQTTPSSSKKSTMKFNDTYTFVVSSVELDTLKVKLKYINAMGSHVTLCEYSLAVQEAVDKSNSIAGNVSIRKSVYEDLKLALGEIYFTVSFKSTVARMRRQKELE